MDVLLPIVPGRTFLMIYRDTEGLFECAHADVFSLRGAMLRLNRWLGEGGVELGTTTDVMLHPQAEFAARRLTELRRAGIVPAVSTQPRRRRLART